MSNDKLIITKKKKGTKMKNESPHSYQLMVACATTIKPLNVSLWQFKFFFFKMASAGVGSGKTS